MWLSKAASVVSFVGALVIGVAASAWFVEMTSLTVSGDWLTITTVNAPDVAVPAPVRAENLLGHWKGSWNYWETKTLTFTIDIDRVDGDKFYGTLSQDGAEIAFEGKFVADSRRVFFHETKVIKLGHYSGWLFGTYNGSLTEDGQLLSGHGMDSWDGYDWAVIKM